MTEPQFPLGSTMVAEGFSASSGFQPASLVFIVDSLVCINLRNKYAYPRKLIRPCANHRRAITGSTLKWSKLTGLNSPLPFNMGNWYPPWPYRQCLRAEVLDIYADLNGEDD
jgi:hypothetical protein